MFRLGLSAAILCTLSLVGCGYLYTSYSSFGEVDVARDREIAKRIEDGRKKPPPATKFPILVDSVPAGIEIASGIIKVLPGFEHKVLGRFTVSPVYQQLFLKEEILGSIKKVIAASGGDAAVISFFGDDAEVATGASGFVITLDPRMKGEPLDTTPLPKKPASKEI